MLSRVFSFAALSAGILTVLATSQPGVQRSFALGSYQVRSDCPKAQTDGQLTISKDPNTSDSQTFVLDNGIAFGFPSNTMVTDIVHRTNQAGQARVEAGERVCKVMVWEETNNSGLFVCSQGQDLECTIHLQKI